MSIKIKVADENDVKYVQCILDTIEEAAKKRGTGIASRTSEYLSEKISQGKAVLALDGEIFAGFSYIESWEGKKFIANSGLIVTENHQGKGLGKRIKKEIFNLSKKKYPNSKIFGLTTGLAVMKINSDLGYRPVTFSELTQDEKFWNGCKGCVNYDILVRTQNKHCLCTGMLYDPNKNKSTTQKLKASIFSIIKK